MSTFICGLFEAKSANDIEDLHRLGWMIADEGRRERLYFHLYSAISQQIVFQITGFSFDKTPLSHLPFLISSSPIWNVSDELLEDQASTITTLTKLPRIFSKLAGHVTRIEMYFPRVGMSDTNESK